MLKFYKDDAGEWRWRVRAKNGRIIADSGEGYKNKKDAMRGSRLAWGFLAEIYQDPIV